MAFWNRKKKDPYENLPTPFAEVCRMLDAYPMEWVEIKSYNGNDSLIAFESKARGVRFICRVFAWGEVRDIQLDKPMSYSLSDSRKTKTVIKAVERAFAYQISQMEIAGMTPTEIALLKIKADALDNGDKN